jgi:hypothetical protein
VGSLFFDFFLKFWCSEKLKCRKLRYRPPYRDSPRNPANFGVLVNSQIQMCLLAFTLPLPEPAQNPIQTMRLLERNNASEISLTKYLVGDPVCHTLAHVGADTEEVSFKDLMDGTGKSKPGYDKIHFCLDVSCYWEFMRGKMLHFLEQLCSIERYCLIGTVVAFGWLTF